MISFLDLILYAAIHRQVSVYKRGYSPWQHAHQQTHVVITKISLIKKDPIICKMLAISLISHYNTYLDSSKLALG